MISSLKNKVIVITGSSRGIGRAIIYKFAYEGASVVINYCKNEAVAHELYEEIVQFNKNCIVVKADVTNEEDVKELYRQTIKMFGKVDILVNNAGVCNDNYLNFLKLEQWKQVIDINLTGTYLCSKIFSKALIKNNGGKIINIASIKGQLGSEGQCNYSAAKAGMIGFTKALAKELGRLNISVNAVCPGFIVTDLNRKNMNKMAIASSMSVLTIESALHDLINFLVFLCSDNLQAVSGQIFNLDSRIK